MPVTAKLSRKFYETLGDDVANELVEWFNVIDATYKSDLRDLNDLNFDRFRAEMRASLAELRADIDRRFAELETRLTRRLFGFWIAQAATTAGLVLGVVRLTH